MVGGAPGPGLGGERGLAADREDDVVGVDGSKPFVYDCGVSTGLRI